MPKCVIGYIHNEKFYTAEQKSFMKLSEKYNVEILFINIGEDLSEKELKEKIKKCDILINRTDEVLAVEVAKTAEALGKNVIETSKTFYYGEDKWLLYVKCMENRIPIPETALLPSTIPGAEKELLKFNRWPLVLKRVDCSEGRFVEKAKDIRQALRTIERFWKRAYERLPIIAQEFIKSYSYRLLLIDGKIVQTEIKRGKVWKLTGVFIKRFVRFKVDDELRKIAEKVAKVTGIKILGIDLLKRDGKWYVIDANSEPCFSDFRAELDSLVAETINFLKREAFSRDRAS